MLLSAMRSEILDLLDGASCVGLGDTPACYNTEWQRPQSKYVPVWWFPVLYDVQSLLDCAVSHAAECHCSFPTLSIVAFEQACGHQTLLAAFSG